MGILTDFSFSFPTKICRISYIPHWYYMTRTSRPPSRAHHKNMSQSIQFINFILSLLHYFSPASYVEKFPSALYTQHTLILCSSTNMRVTATHSYKTGREGGDTKVFHQSQKCVSECIITKRLPTEFGNDTLLC